MTKTKSIDDLQFKIETLVREHMALQRQAATAAIERAFLEASRSSTSAAERPRRGPRKGFRKRPPEEMNEVGELLLAAVHANPGETITAIAEELGSSRRSLTAPMIKLRKAGLVRCAGQRNLTRYFPMTSKR